MKVYTRSCTVAAPVDEVFGHSTSVAGFRRQFPFPVRWRAGPAAAWSQGSEIDFDYRVCGRWLRHRARVVKLEANRGFVDELEEGVYAFFRHTHCFEATARGTRVTDHVEFTLGRGAWCDWGLGLPTLAYTFGRRHRALQEHFGKVCR